ncbi:MAG: hypothetical protein Q8N92_03555 [Erysipelotrichaceae bacterium]|nr:hypothetical protein [Erysipelotrichaceae bacterium]
MSFIEWIENDNIHKYSISNKDEYYDAIFNLKRSFTGRFDVKHLNNFIAESAELLVNAIRLFENGYFDAAYYSLRTSLEVSVLVVYFSDFPESDDIKDQKVMEWRKKGRFPTTNKLLSKLRESGQLYKEISVVMPEFFADFRENLSKLNKHVHKQGFDYFYVSRKFKSDEFISNKIKEFEYHLTKTISQVGVFRLFIDPIPVLLVDEEIYYRLPNMLLNDAYSERFLMEYIGEELVNKYKNTSIYIDFYNYYSDFPKQPKCVSDIIQFQFVDITERDQILEYFHLINNNEHRLVVQLLFCVSKIVRVHSSVFYRYETERVRKNDFFSIDYENYRLIKDCEIKSNIGIEDRFITCLKSSSQNIEVYLEHYDKLDYEEITAIYKIFADDTQWTFEVEVE